MTRFRRFSRSFLATVMGGILLVAAANYVIDPYDVFQTSFLKREFERNERFSKIEFLKHNTQRFNSYILGSSRVLVVNPRTLEHYLPGTRFYNLGAKWATQIDLLRHLEYLLSSNYPLRTLFLQIDIDFLHLKIRDTEFCCRPHPDVLRENEFVTYFQYLTIFPYKNLTRKVMLNWAARQNQADATPTFDIQETGRILRPRQDAQIARDHEDYIKQEGSFHRKAKRGRYKNPQENLEALRKIKSLCLERRLTCLFFIAPHHQRMMDALNAQLYYDALADISRITDFYDFSGYNTVTMDDHNFYETSHYRAPVGDWIAARVFNDAAHVPQDFGVFVTRANFNDHLATVRRQIEERDKHAQAR